MPVTHGVTGSSPVRTAKAEESLEALSFKAFYHLYHSPPIPIVYILLSLVTDLRFRLVDRIFYYNNN